MDSLKLVVFLAAACITLGSPVIEKKLKETSPETKEQMRMPVVEELDKPKETDADRSPATKRADPGSVIAGIQLGVEVLRTILEAIGSANRKIAIGVENETGYTWEALNVYFLSGTSDVSMPREVPTGKAFLYRARKTWGAARGAVEVMSYYIPDLHQTLAVMFSVPYDYNWYSNWWDVKLFRGKCRADYSIYKNMYYGYPSEGDDGWHDKYLGSSLKIHGLMTSSGTSTLEIHVKKN